MKRLIAKVKVPDILYHATYKCNLDSIKEKGLIPGFSNNWDGMQDSNAVYLAIDEDVAESYAEVAQDEMDEDNPCYDSEIIVLKIDTSQLDLNKFGKDVNVLDDDEEMSTVAYYGEIPNSAINF
jgi:hypothetical protein